MKYKILFASIIIFAVTLTFVSIMLTESDPKVLLKPDFRIGGIEISSKLSISGTAFPKSKLIIYIDGKYFGSANFNTDGNFSEILDTSNLTDGKHEIKVKQIYKDTESEFSEKITFQVDNSPPRGSFHITAFSLKTSPLLVAQVSGTADDASVVYVGETRYPVIKGAFEIRHPVVEGENKLDFVLADQFDNKTSIIHSAVIKVDSQAPSISTFYCPSNQITKPTQENVCITSGQFIAYPPEVATVPLDVKVQGAIKYVTVDGKKLKFEEGKVLFQRIPLYVRSGTNKFKVVTEDGAGNRAEEYLTITLTTQDSYSDLEDRLDDIESKIDNLEQ